MEVYSTIKFGFPKYYAKEMTSKEIIKQERKKKEKIQYLESKKNQMIKKENMFFDVLWY